MLTKYLHLRALALKQIVLYVQLDETVFVAGQDLGSDLIQALLRRGVVADLHQEESALKEGVTKDFQILFPAN